MKCRKEYEIGLGGDPEKIDRELGTLLSSKRTVALNSLITGAYDAFAEGRPNGLAFLLADCDTDVQTLKLIQRKTKDVEGVFANLCRTAEAPLVARIAAHQNASDNGGPMGKMLQVIAENAAAQRGEEELRGEMRTVAQPRLTFEKFKRDTPADRDQKKMKWRARKAALEQNLKAGLPPPPRT